MLDFVSPLSNAPLHRDGDYLVSDNGELFPIVDDIPRFVQSRHYVDSFGLEWKIHNKTQLDSFTQTTISRDRLTRCLGMSLDHLAGKLVLEAGCGAGRFTELMVDAGAHVHAIDLSIAVEANRDNVGTKKNYRVAQADLYRTPYASNSFDYVICLGVLQHLPSPEVGMYSLLQKLKPGGWLIIDHYTPAFSVLSKISFWTLRPILKRLPPIQAKMITDTMVKLFFPLHWASRQISLAEGVLSRFSPILFYYRAFPQLSREEHYELSRLDSFDSLTDYYKHLRTVGQISEFLAVLRLEDIQVARGGNGVEARGRKPMLEKLGP